MKTLWMRFLAACLLFGPSDGLQCKDDNNRPVDWFIIHKMPAMRSSKDPRINQGTAYVYVTSIDRKNSWTLSEKDVTVRDSALGNTFAPLYNDTIASQSSWIIYNDQETTVDRSQRDESRAKGVVMVNEKQGFWMVHSAGQFPLLRRSGVVSDSQVQITTGKYDYPVLGRTRAQMFLCMSIPTDQLGGIGKQLLYSQIKIRQKHLQSHLMGPYRDFVEASNWRSRDDWRLKTSVVLVRSSNNFVFRTHAASPVWQKDFWDDLVGPDLETDLWVVKNAQSCKQFEPKCDGKYKVENIERIKIREAGVEYNTAMDNSRWAISPNGRWVCIGDVNRSGTKIKRPGGAVCMEMQNVHAIFRGMVGKLDECPSVTNDRKRKRVPSSGA